MNQNIGYGITPRNQHQQELGVLKAEFARQLAHLGVNTFEDLQTRLERHQVNIGSITAELATLEARDRESAGIRMDMINSFRSFFTVVTRTTGSGLGILRALDPAFPADPTIADFNDRIQDMEAHMEENIINMTPETFATIDAIVRQSSSVDYVREFSAFSRARTAYQGRMNIGGRDVIVQRLADARAAASTDQGHYDQLLPIHTRLNEAKKRAKISDLVSRATTATLTLLAAGGLSIALGGSPKLGSNTPASVSSIVGTTPSSVNVVVNVGTQPVEKAGHYLTKDQSGKITLKYIDSNQVNNIAGTLFQFDIAVTPNGDISGNMNYQLPGSSAFTVLDHVAKGENTISNGQKITLERVNDKVHIIYNGQTVAF